MNILKERPIRMETDQDEHVRTMAEVIRSTMTEKEIAQAKAKTKPIILSL